MYDSGGKKRKHAVMRKSVCLCKTISNTLSRCFMPFCFNIPCQFILLNLHILSFGLMTFGWFICMYSFSDGNIISDLPLFELHPSFSGMQLGRTKKKGWVYC
jgi:hypothetical protein